MRLTQDCQKVIDDQPSKPTRGVLDGAYVRLPAIGDSNTLIIAEGPETGLSVWAATGYETWICLGGVSRADLPTGRRVIIAKEDDAYGSATDRALSKALVRWKVFGADVAIATPWHVRRQDKTDFNDVMKAAGAAAVRRRIAVAVSDTVHRVTAARARDSLRNAVRDFRVAAVKWRRPKEAEAAIVNMATLAAIVLPAKEKEPPPVHAIRVDTGTGKSMIARSVAASSLAAMRRAGSKKTIAIAVPTHKLGEEQAELFMNLPIAKKNGLTAAVWRGRERGDPANPGETMCRNLEAVSLAQYCLTSVQSAVCEKKTENGIERCPLFFSCAYQRQLKKNVDVWFVPHELLFGAKPEVIGDLAAVIVDESAWQDGVPTDPTFIPIDTLNSTADIPDDSEATAHLQHLRDLALKALSTMPADGPIRRIDFIAELDEETAREAYALEYERRLDPEMRPSHTLERRKEQAAKVSRHNQAVKALAGFWRSVADMLADPSIDLSGSVARGAADFAGHELPALILKRRGTIRAGWQVPTLLLDATLNIDLNRPFWPQIEKTADLAVEAPFMRVRQVTDQTYAKSRFDATKIDPASDEARRRYNRLRDLRAALWREARRHAPRQDADRSPEGCQRGFGCHGRRA